MENQKSILVLAERIAGLVDGDDGVYERVHDEYGKGVIYCACASHDDVDELLAAPDDVVLARLVFHSEERAMALGDLVYGAVVADRAHPIVVVDAGDAGERCIVRGRATKPLVVEGAMSATTVPLIEPPTTLSDDETMRWESLIRERERTNPPPEKRVIYCIDGRTAAAADTTDVERISLVDGDEFESYAQQLSQWSAGATPPQSFKVLTREIRAHDWRNCTPVWYIGRGVDTLWFIDRQRADDESSPAASTGPQ